MAITRAPWLFVCGFLASTIAFDGCAARQARAIEVRQRDGHTAPIPADPSTPLVPDSSYVIGPDDVLSIVFWREQDLTRDVVVRPDGRIAIPLLNEVQAAGLTPEQLRVHLVERAAQFLEDPNATVVVKQINSRRVFITGNIGKPGAYNLIGPTTVVQLISMAGGLAEYADRDHIMVVHAEKSADGQPLTATFNYSQLMKGRNLRQNIELKPGDTVIVP
jgi:polysaccharide biosynthesis/export protein